MAEVLSRWERRGLQQGLEKGLEQGREQGREQGLVEGMSTMLLRQLQGKRITPDAATERRIRSLDGETLLALADALLGFQSRADLDAWLAQAATAQR